jgi:hypothetical protein
MAISETKDQLCPSPCHENITEFEDKELHDSFFFFFFGSTLTDYDNFKIQAHRNTDRQKTEFTPSSSFVDKAGYE